MNIFSTGSEARQARALPASPAGGAARSLRVRLALGLGLLAVALTTALTLVIGELATAVARKEIGRYLTRLSIEMRDKLDVGMFERVSEIEMLARLDSGMEGARSPAARNAMLAELKRATPDYAWLGYADAAGRVQVSLDGVLQGADVSARAWFRRAMTGGATTGDVREAKLLAGALARTGAGLPRIVDISFPLREAGRIRGVVGAYVSWTWAARLRDSIESYALPEAPYQLLVIAQDGLVLLGPPALQGTRLERRELIPSRLRVYDARLERWADGETYLTGASATRGYRDFRGLGWSVLVRQRADFAFAPVHLLQKRIAFAGGLIALLAIALGWWIASRVSDPLVGISTAADAISRGSRRVQIPSAGGYAEVERLSASLRSMLSSLTGQEEDLRQAQDRLEGRVRERTAELVKARAEVELEAAEHQIARDEAAAAKEQLALALEASRLAIWDYDVASGKVFLSDAWLKMLGVPPAPTTATIEELTALVPADDRAGVSAALATALKGPDSAYRVEHRVGTAAGGVIWIVSEGRVVARGADGRALRMIGTNRDITDRVHDAEALRESEEQFRGAMQNSAIGMAIIGLDGRWQKVNPALCEIVGYSEQELLERTYTDVTHPEDHNVSPERLRGLYDGTQEKLQFEKRYVHKDGHPVWVQVNVSLVRDSAGRPLHLVSQIIDVSERRLTQERIEHLALHDALTGLPNARLLADRMEQAIANARRAGRPMGVLYMDLDGFKPVNDEYGHAAGDLVLREVAARMRENAREADSIARVGGDEFVVVLAEVAGEKEAAAAASRVLAAFDAPIGIGGAAVTIHASIGIALYPQHGTARETLLAHADAAMYQAKRGGKNSYRFYSGDAT